MRDTHSRETWVLSELVTTGRRRFREGSRGVADSVWSVLNAVVGSTHSSLQNQSDVRVGAPRIRRPGSQARCFYGSHAIDNCRYIYFVYFIAIHKSYLNPLQPTEYWSFDPQNWEYYTQYGDDIQTFFSNPNGSKLHRIGCAIHNTEKHHEVKEGEHCWVICTHKVQCQQEK